MTGPTLDLEPIRARLNAIPVGGWDLPHDPEHPEQGCVSVGNYGWVATGSGGPEYDVDSDQGRADAEFIAHAPADIDALLAEIDKLQARIDAAMAVYGRRLDATNHACAEAEEIFLADLRDALDGDEA